MVNRLARAAQDYKGNGLTQLASLNAPRSNSR